MPGDDEEKGGLSRRSTLAAMATLGVAAGAQADAASPARIGPTLAQSFMPIRRLPPEFCLA